MAENPTWVAPLLLLLALGVLAAFLIPEEVVEQSTRKMLSKMPGMGGAAAAELDSHDYSPTSVTNLLSGAVGMTIVALFTALWALLLFRGILGGEGRFKQYFSMVLIAGFVAFAGGLVSIPLQIRSNDLFATLSVGTLLPFLGEGFLRTWMNCDRPLHHLAVHRSGHRRHLHRQGSGPGRRHPGFSASRHRDRHGGVRRVADIFVTG